MHETKLSDMINQLIEKDKKNGYFHDEEFSRKYYLTHLDFFGNENKHLFNPKNHTDNIYQESSRDEEDILNGDEIVYGDLLLHSASGHDGLEFVYSISSLKEAEEKIISVGGIFNRFSGDINIFEKGKLKPYELFIEDNKGNRLYFVKGAYDDLFFDLYEAGFHIEINWL